MFLSSVIGAVEVVCVAAAFAWSVFFFQAVPPPKIRPKNKNAATTIPAMAPPERPPPLGASVVGTALPVIIVLYLIQ